jgi:hypothetical protein
MENALFAEKSLASILPGRQLALMNESQLKRILDDITGHLDYKKSSNNKYIQNFRINK